MTTAEKKQKMEGLSAIYAEAAKYAKENGISVKMVTLYGYTELENEKWIATVEKNLWHPEDGISDQAKEAFNNGFLAKLFEGIE